MPPPRLIKTHLFPASLETQLFIESDLIRHSVERRAHTKYYHCDYNTVPAINIIFSVYQLFRKCSPVFPIGYLSSRHHLRCTIYSCGGGWRWLVSPSALIGGVRLPVTCVPGHHLPAPPSYWLQLPSLPLVASPGLARHKHQPGGAQ